VDPETVARGSAQGLDAVNCLNAADAGTLVTASGDPLVTGPTGTNVTDVIVVLKGNPAPPLVSK
jgi:glycerate 2-kinase